MGPESNQNQIFLSTLPARGATKREDKMLNQEKKFLSTLPARGATWPILPHGLTFSISIHAPREGSDSKNREENPCFCFIIQHSARIWKNCFYKKGKTGKIHAKLACHTGAKGTGKRWVLHLRTGWQAMVKRAGDRPAQRAGEHRRVRPCFGSGCPADRSADCPERGR